MPACVTRFSELTDDGGGSFQVRSSGYFSSVAWPRYFTALTSSRAWVGTRAGMNPLLVYSNAINDPVGQRQRTEQPGLGVADHVHLLGLEIVAEQIGCAGIVGRAVEITPVRRINEIARRIVFEIVQHFERSIASCRRSVDLKANQLLASAHVGDRAGQVTGHPEKHRYRRCRRRIRIPDRRFVSL